MLAMRPFTFKNKFLIVPATALLLVAGCTTDGGALQSHPWGNKRT